MTTKPTSLRAMRLLLFSQPRARHQNEKRAEHARDRDRPRELVRGIRGKPKPRRVDARRVFRLRIARVRHLRAEVVALIVGTREGRVGAEKYLAGRALPRLEHEAGVLRLA